MSPPPTPKVFRGLVHRITYRWSPARTPGRDLVVGFSDMAPEPDFTHEDDLAGLDVNRLYILDEHSFFTRTGGYPGCWYLGERRRFSFAEDVQRLVEQAMSSAGSAPAQVLAAGRGKGGFAALWHAIAGGWGHALLGSPHFRLGTLLEEAGLPEAVEFIAGGSGSAVDADARWLDSLLPAALRAAERLPRVQLHAAARNSNYGEHVLPLIDALERCNADVGLQLSNVESVPGAAESAFAADLFDTVARRTEDTLTTVALDARAVIPRPRGKRLSRPRILGEDQGARCFLDALPDGDPIYAVGARLPIRPFSALLLDLTVRRPGSVETVIVEALDEAGEPVLSWRWSVEATWAPPSGRHRHLLRPGISAGPFRAKSRGALDQVRDVDVFVRARGGSTVDFTLHGLAVLPHPLPAPTAQAPALLLDDGADARPFGRLQTESQVVGLVRELVAEGSFPPSAVVPVGPIARPELSVVGILDPFSQLGFRFEFRFTGVTPTDFRQVIDRERPDLLFVESAWRGKDDTWQHLVGDKNGTGPSEPLRELVATCQREGIPTIFWNKEDPPNFEYFVSTAALFDQVFTTDEDCVPWYQERLGHARIDVLPFALQPRIHNPIGSPALRPLDVAFLGTFYGRKHPDRKLQMEAVLDPAREFGLHVYSRVENKKGYEFPVKYVPHLIGTLPYERVLGAYHTYKVLLNVNSVIASRTMCARRIFEILGCGGAVVSGSSPAISHMLGPGVVHECSDGEETRDALHTLLHDEGIRDRGSVTGLRRVLEGHTYRDRVDTMLATVGLGASKRDRSVALVALVEPEDVVGLAETIDRQNHDDIELVLVAPASSGQLPEVGDALRRSGKRGVRVVTIADGAMSAQCLAAGLAATDAAFVGVLDPTAFYGEHYVRDLVCAFEYADAGIVGKGEHYRTGDGGRLAVGGSGAQEYTEHVLPEAMLMRRDVVDRVPLRGGTWQEALHRWQSDAREMGFRIYAADRFNFVGSRHGQEPLRRESRVEVFAAGVMHAVI